MGVAGHTQKLNAPDIDEQVYQANSGHIFDVAIVVRVMDFYDQVIVTDSGLRVWAGAANTLTYLMGDVANITLHGVATFNNLGFIASPDNSYRVRFNAEGVEEGRSKIKVRGCRRGELWPLDYHGRLGQVCFPCPMGMFSYDTTDTECSMCPVGAVCLGGDHSIARDGYWRTKNNTFGVWDKDLQRHRLAVCLDPQGCKGSPEVDLLPGRSVDFRHIALVRTLVEGCRVRGCGCGPLVRSRVSCGRVRALPVWRCVWAYMYQPVPHPTYRPRATSLLRCVATRRGTAARCATGACRVQGAEARRRAPHAPPGVSAWKC